MPLTEGEARATYEIADTKEERYPLGHAHGDGRTDERREDERAPTYTHMYNSNS